MEKKSLQYIIQNIKIKIDPQKELFDEIKPLESDDGFVLFGVQEFTENENQIFKKSYSGKPPYDISKKAPKYRYFYSKIWDETKPVLFFVLLNPSTADANHMDPTVTNCFNIAKKWKTEAEKEIEHGGLAVVNLFALRSPRPGILKKIENPDNLKKINRDFLKEVFKIKNTDFVIAWGLNKNYEKEKEIIRPLIKKYIKANIYTLRRDCQSQKNEERHPSNQAWSRIKDDNGNIGFNNAAILCPSIKINQLPGHP